MSSIHAILGAAGPMAFAIGGAFALTRLTLRRLLEWARII